jgi:glycosyltransferase involved in cell wall biosynthesis
MKLLYLSCHATLEYDELKLFEELGIDYFALGSYVIPTRPADPIRPPLKHAPDKKLYNTPLPAQHELTPELVEPFDTVMVMHRPDWISKNWDIIKGKRVIWRTIGQSVGKIEQKLRPYRDQGLQVVRYSPREINIPFNIGADAVIRFYKDPNEYNHWIGGGTEFVTFAQDMHHRGEFLQVDAFLELVKDFNAHVYGPKNEALNSLNGGFLTYEAMKQKYRDCRGYIYTGTQPASYTLTFIEAMMTGAPMICLGPKHGESLNLAQDLYEIPDLIQNEYNGFISDDLGYLRQKMQELKTNIKLARRISETGRQTAIEFFGKDNIKKQWEDFLYDDHR